MRSRGQRGSALIEAVVAAALAGIALGGLATTAALATRSLRLVRDTGNALALAGERLEALRAGPRAAGTDTCVTPDGTSFTRSWSVAGGRGTPVRLSARMSWGVHTLVLATEAFP